jgi:GT2 family glycosyltransferase
MRIRKAGFKIGYTPHAVVYHELNPNRYGRAYNRHVEYRKGMSRSLYRRDSMTFNVVPNLFANCLRLALYRSLGKPQKAYKTEGRLFKCLGYVAGKLRGVPGPK